MLKRFEFIILTVAAAVFLVMVIASVTIARSSRALQAEINERQQFIATTTQLEVLNRELIRALAELAARSGDEQVRSLLNANGITFSVDPKAAPAAKR